MPSTVIADMACDPETETLSVWFRPSGHRCDYSGVPAAVYAALRHSRSRGRYFNAHIRDRYPFTRADGPRISSPTSATMPETYTPPVTRG